MVGGGELHMYVWASGGMTRNFFKGTLRSHLMQSYRDIMTGNVITQFEGLFVVYGLYNFTPNIASLSFTSRPSRATEIIEQLANTAQSLQ